MHVDDKHHLTFQFLKNKELDEIYIGTTIRSFAIALISLFVPIYFLTIGYQFSHVLLFYIFVHLSGFISIPLAVKSMQYLGVKHTIATNSVLTILFYYLLHTLASKSVPLILLGLVFSLASMSYWVPFHVFFARTSSEKKTGSQFGLMQVLSFAMTVLAPIVGGYLTTIYSNGFVLLFVISGILLVVSGLVFLYTKDTKEELHFSFKNVFKILTRRDIFALVGDRFRNFAAAILWPVYMFMLLDQTLSIGVISAIANTLLTFLTAFIGRISDVYDRFKLIRFGGLAHSLTLFVRGFVSTFSQMLVVQFLGAFTFSFLYIPYRSLLYSKSRKFKVLDFIVAQELLFRAAAIIFSLIVLLMTFYWGPFVAMGVGFIVGAIGSTMMTSVRL
jgi:MFS family permease